MSEGKREGREREENEAPEWTFRVACVRHRWFRIRAATKEEAKVEIRRVLDAHRETILGRLDGTWSDTELEAGYLAPAGKREVETAGMDELVAGPWS